MNEITIHPLQKARKKLGIKQRVLADLTGLSEPTIKRAEGSKALDTYSISAICDYFTQRYGRQVTAKELGLHTSWESEESNSDNDEQEEMLTTPQNYQEQGQVSVNGQSNHHELPLSAKQKLQLKIEARDWDVWAGMKLVQILKMVSSSSSQSHSYEEICEEIQTFLDQEIKMLDDMMPLGDAREKHFISRRQALIMIAALPSMPLSWNPSIATSIVAEQFLPQCAASITACWHLLQEQGLTAVEEILPTYLPMLMTLALRPSKYQIAAARLATLANMLRAIVAKHRLKDNERERYCNEAIRCSYFSNERRLQAAALMSLGYTYLFCLPFRLKAAIETFQNALQTLGNEASLLKSDIYIGLADAHAQCQEEREALECIAQAQNHFPSHPEYDPSFLYADCSLPVLYQWEGKMCLHLAEHYPSQDYYEKAFYSFEKATEAHPLHDRGTSEIIIDQANAALGMGELSIYTSYLRKGVELAVTLGSQRRYNEAYAVYQQTPNPWHSEQQIRALAIDAFGEYSLRKGQAS